MKRETVTTGRKNTAPLQKRLQGVSQGKIAEDKKTKRRRTSSSDEGVKGKGIGSKTSSSSSNNRVKANESTARRDTRPGGSGSAKEQKAERSNDKTKPSEPFKMSLPKNKIKLTLTTAKATAKPNSAVLEKLGMTNEDMVEAKKALKRKQELESEAAKKAKMDSMTLMETLKERLKNKVEAGKSKAVEGDKAKVKPAVPAATVVQSVAVAAKIKEAKKAKVKEGPDAKGRREELLKQLKAVEDAIHRKRTKLDA